MVTPWIFTAFVVLLALQRLFEPRRSSRNEAVIRSRGGREYGAWQVPAMKAMHAAWFMAMLVEVQGMHRPFIPGLSLLALVVFWLDKLYVTLLYSR